MVGPEPRPKATVHSFFPVQTFEAQIQMLPLIRITEQQKQTKCTYWPGQNTRSDCRRAALFFLIEALIKVSLWVQTDTQEEQLPVGVLHLKSFLWLLYMAETCWVCHSRTAAPAFRAFTGGGSRQPSGPFGQPDPNREPLFICWLLLTKGQWQAHGIWKIKAITMRRQCFLFDQSFGWIW